MNVGHLYTIKLQMDCEFKVEIKKHEWRKDEECVEEKENKRHQQQQKNDMKAYFMLNGE